MRTQEPQPADKMRFTDFVLSTKPAVATILFVALFVICGIAINFFPLGGGAWSAAFSVAVLAVLGPVMLWQYSLYRAASDRNAERIGYGGRRGFLFVLAVGGYCGFCLLLPILVVSARNEPPNLLLATGAVSFLAVGNLAYFASIWAAAQALIGFEGRGNPAQTHGALKTFALTLYAPVGVWVLYRRIKLLLAAPAAGEVGNRVEA